MEHNSGRIFSKMEVRFEQHASGLKVIGHRDDYRSVLKGCGFNGLVLYTS